MILFHTIHSITINDFGLVFDYPENVKKVQVWMPKKLVSYAAKRLIKRFNDIVNPDNVNAMLEDKYYITNLDIRISLYVVLIDVLKHSATIPMPIEILDIYKKHFKKEFEPDDLQKLINKLAALRRKQSKAINNFETSNTDDSFDFVQFILSVERILEMQIGEQKLYKLPYYMAQVEKIAKQKNK